FSVRACADPDVVAEAPVVQVVAAAEAGPRIRRDLVALVARAREERAARRFDLLHGFVVRERRRTAMKRGVRLERELIPGDVRRSEGDRALEVRERACDR